jgi:hypothetical protein
MDESGNLLEMKVLACIFIKITAHVGQGEQAEMVFFAKKSPR